MILKATAIPTPTLTYQIDHLAVIALIMDIPLLCLDENDAEIAQKYYPGLKVERVDYFEFSPAYLAEQYRYLFLSDLSQSPLLKRKIAQTTQDTPCQIFCPHGFSDKNFYFKYCLHEDLVLVYGQNMLDQLASEGIQLNSYVLVGNYRHAFYLKHKQFFDDLVQTEVWAKFSQKKPIIIYAPTWRDQADSSTFFEAASILIEQLPEDYNLLIKLHPRLELDDAVGYYQLIGKYENKKNLLFLRDYPLIYPLLSSCEIYIGDLSSVGYDFLAFNRPMFFLKKPAASTTKTPSLDTCGVSISPDQYTDVYKMIESHLAEDRSALFEYRKQFYQYTFTPNLALEQVKENILEACLQKK